MRLGVRGGDGCYDSKGAEVGREVEYFVEEGPARIVLNKGFEEGGGRRGEGKGSVGALHCESGGCEVLREVQSTGR